jgi:hypothetical protein
MRQALNMEDIIRTLPKLLRAAGDSEELRQAAAKAAWKRAAGDGMRGNAVPVRLYQKTLIVAVYDAGWQKQLEEIAGQLLFRLNSLLGRAVVSYIEFRIDRKTVELERQVLRSRAVERDEQERRALKRADGGLLTAAKGIKDRELRRRFLVAAGSCLERLETAKS